MVFWQLKSVSKWEVVHAGCVASGFFPVTDFMVGLYPVWDFKSIEVVVKECQRNDGKFR